MGRGKYTSKILRCLVTGKALPDLHHVKTRGAGGGDEPWNLMPLSREAHSEVHFIGLTRFAEKYPTVRKWLSDNGWTQCPVLLRWVRSN
jgi:hypothetical protein